MQAPSWYCSFCDHADEPESETEPQKNRWLKFAGAIAGGCLLLVLVAALKEYRNQEPGGGIKYR